MLRAIFYARFHPERGPCILHQSPRDAIISDTTSNQQQGLLSFADVSPYVIPAHEICNAALSVCSNGLRLLGFPVSLEDAKYARNRFAFNVCYVLDDDVEPRAWGAVVRKTACFFQALEEESGLLQAGDPVEDLKLTSENENHASYASWIDKVLHQIVDDLNAYGETCARVDSTHVLNLRLPTLRPRPAPVEAWHVPLLTRPLPDADRWTCDLVLQQIRPHIDGVKHVQRIAELADVEPISVKKAIGELVYHRHAIILDTFHFQAIYAVTNAFAYFVENQDMVDECCAYVAAPREISSTSIPQSSTIIALYRALSTGTTLQELSLSHADQLHNIDIRRLITYGVIKRFLRRIHKYALSIESQASTPRPSNGSFATNPNSLPRNADQAWKTAALSSGWPTPPTADTAASRAGKESHEDQDQDGVLEAFLDGNHCLDEICVAMHLSEAQVMERLASGRVGEVMLVAK